MQPEQIAAVSTVNLSAMKNSNNNEKNIKSNLSPIKGEGHSIKV